MAETLNQKQIDEEFQNVVGAQSEKWRHCSGQSESTLLRLAILRELMKSLHAQRSRCLATGRKDLTQALRVWENRLAELRTQPRLEGELQELVTGKSEVKKRTRLLPEALYTAIPRDKLERYDRLWEAALAAEACTLGWRFWSLETWVEITLAEEWNRRLYDQLWPSAIILFAESADTPVPSTTRPRPPTTAMSAETALWRGRWVLIVDPRFKTPAEIASNMAQWPGSPPEPPSPPQWKLLFSPQKR